MGEIGVAWEEVAPSGVVGFELLGDGLQEGVLDLLVEFLLRLLGVIKLNILDMLFLWGRDFGAEDEEEGLFLLLLLLVRGPAGEGEGAEEERVEIGSLSGGEVEVEVEVEVGGDVDSWTSAGLLPGAKKKIIIKKKREKIIYKTEEKK